MTNLEKAILATLVYYDLLKYPLTSVELFRYLSAQGRGVSFLEVEKTLKTSPALKEKIESHNGLYYLRGRGELVGQREAKMKLAQTKWRKLKRGAKWLALVPFLRLVAVTGSLTAYNARPESDFDLLAVMEGRRFWLSRLLMTGLVEVLGKRRKSNRTKDRFCLNCYLTQEALEITVQAKRRDFHSAQEYGRLIPIFEVEPVYQKFIKANHWLKDYLANYPWSSNLNSKRIKKIGFFEFTRKFLELLLDNKTGELVEKASGWWQRRRIMEKKEHGPADQVYISDQSLFFHPDSKGFTLMNNFNLKYNELIR